MSKIAVVYWSGTGNTESMAASVADGARERGAEVDLFQVSDFDASMLENYDALAFGCPPPWDRRSLSPRSSSRCGTK